MATNDTCCTIAPYFKVQDGKLDVFKELCERFVETTRASPDVCITVSVLAPISPTVGRVTKTPTPYWHTFRTSGALLEEMPQSAEIVKLQIHGPEEELAKLREPLSELNPEFFTLEYGFRK